MRRALLAIAILAARPARADDTDELAKQVSKVRGLSIKKPIKRAAVDDAGLRERLLARLGAADAGQQLALERWGLIEHGVDVHALMIDLLVQQIAAFYDPDDSTLYTVGAEASPTLLAHEIEHALQDQHWKLTKLTKVPADDADARLARQALIEGDGEITSFETTLAAQDIAPPWGQPDATALLEHTIEGDDGSALAHAPLVVRDYLLFPYARGMRFVAALRARDPWSTVDDAFAHPPASTEQILHPELYLAGEKPEHVTAKTPACLSDWRTVHASVWGEAGWSVLLRQLGVSTERATEAAAGWGGDRVMLYGRGGASSDDTVAVALTAWDEDIDAVEFEDAVTDALDTLVAGTIVENGNGRVVWIDASARVSLVERRDDQVLVVIGAPLAARATIADDVWKAWKVK